MWLRSTQIKEIAVRSHLWTTIDVKYIDLLVSVNSKVGCMYSAHSFFFRKFRVYVWDVFLTEILLWRERIFFNERTCCYISLPRYTRGASVVNLDPQCFRPNLVFFTFLLHNYYIFLLQFCLYFCHCFLTFLLHFVTFCYNWVRGVSAICCHFGPTIIQPPRIQLLFIKLQGIHSNQSF